MDVRFCPHCGEDLSALTAAPAPEQPAAAPAREIIQREVTSQEVERIWGLLPLPFQMKPFGVVVEGPEHEIVALAVHDHEQRLLELARGVVKIMDAASSPAPSAAPTPLQDDKPAPMTIPLHNCAADGMTKEERGRARFGSR